jgi:hypothetical protein
VTALWIILACIAFMIVAGAARGRVGVAIGDTTTLVILLGVIGIVNLVLARFFDVGGIAWTLAGLIAFGFAFDALYGLMAPGRQRHRDQWLRARMQRKRA